MNRARKGIRLPVNCTDLRTQKNKRISEPKGISVAMTNDLLPTGQARTESVHLRTSARRLRSTIVKSAPAKSVRRVSGEFAEACLEILPTPVMLVDESLRLMFANAAARTLLVAGIGMRVSSERVQLADPDAQRLLASLVMSLTRPGEPTPKQRIVLARRAVSASPLRLAVLRMPVHDADPDGGGTCMARLFVDDPDRRPQPLFETLRELHGVTAAEARLALALYEGDTIDEAARKFGVSTLTVRTQLKSLFSRMGVHSQSQLVRELGVLAIWTPSRLR
jgi:DNA-binding CsgD family transcriptional regulator